jgi:hypothetical protein
VMSEAPRDETRKTLLVCVKSYAIRFRGLESVLSAKYG